VVLSDRQDATDPRAAPAPLERKGDLERKAPWVLLVEMASKALLVYLVLQALKAHPERTATRVRSVNLDRREAKQTRVNRDLQVRLVFRALSEPPVQLAAMVSQDPEVSRACLARRETRGHEVSPACPDPSDCRGCPAHQARRERTVTWAPWVLPVPQAPEALRAPVELMVHKDPPVVLVLREATERREKMARLATPDHLASPEPEASEERTARRENQDRREQPGPPEHEDQAEMTVPRVTLALSASPETLAPLVNPVPVALMDYQETKEMMETPVRLVPLVHPERQECPVLLANGAPLDKQGRREDKVKRDPRARAEQRGLWVRPDLLDCRGLLGSPVQRGFAASPAQLVNKDFLVPLVKTALLGPLDLLDYLA